MSNELRKNVDPVLSSGDGKLVEAGQVFLVILGDKRAKKELLKPYDNVVEGNPRWSQAFARRAQIMFRIQEYDDAIKDYMMALKNGENEARAAARHAIGLRTLPLRGAPSQGSVRLAAQARRSQIAQPVARERPRLREGQGAPGDSRRGWEGLTRHFVERHPRSGPSHLPQTGQAGSPFRSAGRLRSRCCRCAMIDEDERRPDRRHRGHRVTRNGVLSSARPRRLTSMKCVTLERGEHLARRPRRDREPARI
jgi:hypothetical protein